MNNFEKLYTIEDIAKILDLLHVPLETILKMEY